jgi:ABC-type multidrug transport system ATPase subunit
VTPVKKFSWNKVSLSIELQQGRKVVEKPLIQNLSGCVMAGELVGIMGGSGAGKTTLLNTLAGRIGPGKLTGKHLLHIQTNSFFASDLIFIGDILVDGHERNSATWKSQCAYVE